jgi:hypothetical protein
MPGSGEIGNWFERFVWEPAKKIILFPLVIPLNLPK